MDGIEEKRVGDFRAQTRVTREAVEIAESLCLRDNADIGPGKYGGKIERRAVDTEETKETGDGGTQSNASRQTFAGVKAEYLPVIRAFCKGKDVGPLFCLPPFSSFLLWDTITTDKEVCVIAKGDREEGNRRQRIEFNRAKLEGFSGSRIDDRLPEAQKEKMKGEEFEGDREITIYVKEFQSRIERDVAGLAKIYEGIEEERSETNRELALAVFKIYCPSDQQAESRNAFCLHAKYCQSTDHA
ncbi:hypothetical protein HZH68_000906 [Vespula germanica]|uniref:Uncharacterized protein n=1 Tax=Vespula germanica TaxID=30212 RepID=A0A834NUF2_VESGE|nr:hypothetical protein HZH68_000906 [Vespula germanica]